MGIEVVENYMGRTEELTLSRRKQDVLPTEGFLYLPTNKGFYPEGAVNMLLAKRLNELVEATPRSVAECPACHEKVIAKCGTINIWHWAHKVKCIYNTEPETEWHLVWKKMARAHGLQIEHIFDDHITDAFDSNTKTCYEFQHSQISPEDLLARSLYYAHKGFRTTWVFDCAKKFEKEQIILRQDAAWKPAFGGLFGTCIKCNKWDCLSDEHICDKCHVPAGDLSIYNFRVKFQKKRIQTIFDSNSPTFGEVYLDLGKSVFNIKKMYSNGSGWGRFAQENIFWK